MLIRHKTKVVKIGKVYLGGNYPVAVQSMTKTDTRDILKTVAQIKRLEKMGCEIVRCAVPDQESAQGLGKIKKRINIPLVADIHFDWRLALESIKQGVDKIRINPGNIGREERVKEIVLAARKAKIPIRIGVNAGSLKTGNREQGRLFGDLPMRQKKKSEEMVESALKHIRFMERIGFDDLIISLKSSDVLTTLSAYRLMAQKCAYPLHLGITEAGPALSGAVKSALGLGILLAEGIGDTIRVSLSAEPEKEVRVGYEILRSLGLRKEGIEIISCPTCGRCQVDLVKVVEEFEEKLSKVPPMKIGGRHRPKSKDLKIAIMGCVVNGPGEAREADIGLAGGRNSGLLFRQGKPIKKVKPKDWVKTLIQEIADY